MSSPAPVVPATAMYDPIRTAREYPTIDSNSEPEDTLRRGISTTYSRHSPTQQVYSRALD
jgi:hypothetical protein